VLPRTVMCYRIWADRPQGPVELATKYLLVINIATAKKLELNLPWFLEQRADEVID
jgi:hypothetical protein